MVVGGTVTWWPCHHSGRVMPQLSFQVTSREIWQVRFTHRHIIKIAWSKRHWYPMIFRGENSGVQFRGPALVIFLGILGSGPGMPNKNSSWSKDLSRSRRCLQMACHGPCKWKKSVAFNQSVAILAKATDGFGCHMMSHESSHSWEDCWDLTKCTKRTTYTIPYYTYTILDLHLQILAVVSCSAHWNLSMPNSRLKPFKRAPFPRSGAKWGRFFSFRSLGCQYDRNMQMYNIYTCICYFLIFFNIWIY